MYTPNFQNWQPQNAGEGIMSQNCECDTCTVTTLCHMVSVNANSVSMWLHPCLDALWSCWRCCQNTRQPTLSTWYIWVHKHSLVNSEADWLNLICHMPEVISSVRAGLMSIKRFVQPLTSSCTFCNNNKPSRDSNYLGCLEELLCYCQMLLWKSLTKMGTFTESAPHKEDNIFLRKPQKLDFCAIFR